MSALSDALKQVFGDTPIPPSQLETPATYGELVLEVLNLSWKEVSYWLADQVLPAPDVLHMIVDLLEQYPDHPGGSLLNLLDKPFVEVTAARFYFEHGKAHDVEPSAGLTLGSYMLMSQRERLCKRLARGGWKAQEERIFKFEKALHGGYKPPRPGTLGEVAESFRGVVAQSPRDWSVNSYDAWLYGIIAGWGENLEEVGQRHRWRHEEIKRLARLRKIFKNTVKMDVEMQAWAKDVCPRLRPEKLERACFGTPEKQRFMRMSRLHIEAIQARVMELALALEDVEVRILTRLMNPKGNRLFSPESGDRLFRERLITWVDPDDQHTWKMTNLGLAVLRMRDAS